MSTDIQSLKEEFRFDSEAGIISWAKGRRAGKQAGWISNQGYREIRRDGSNILAHRLAWLLFHGEWPVLTIDHINGKRGDNRIENLRIADRAEQMKNRAMPKTNTSGAVGVTFHKKTGRWQAGIQVKGRHIHLGLFDNISEAKKVRAAAEIEYGFHKNHGEKRP